MRNRKYREAIAEGTVQAMKKDSSIFVIGEGVDDQKGIFGTTRLAFEEFGPSRVFDTPLSENAITGWGTGAALNGLRPLMVHARNDFLLLAMDQLVNHAAKWRYMHGEYVPWTIRAIIGRSWGQAAQHSQALHSIFAYFPGLKVVMPATPFDAKGLIIASLFDSSPVIILEHRMLYETNGEVPEEVYETPIGKAKIIQEGNDVTIVAISHMVLEALEASRKLQEVGISVEVIDLRSIRPYDKETILKSVRKTGRIIVCDVGWKQFGISAEIISEVTEKEFSSLKVPPIRIGLPDSPTPCSYALEDIYYPDYHSIITAVKKVLPIEHHTRFEFLPKEKEQQVIDFFGPF